MVIRELLLKLGLDMDEAKFAKGAAAGNLIAEGFKKAAELGKELVHSFVENIEKSIEYGDRIKRTGQQIGIATEALQELEYAASLSDISQETLSKGLTTLGRNMFQAKEGSEAAAEAFKGIEFKKANGELKTIDEAFSTIAEKFAEMPDGQKKIAQAMGIFGKAGKDLIPFLNKGADGIEELREEAYELGLVLDKDAIEASDELSENMNKLAAVSQGLWRNAIAPLLPAISELVKDFLAWRKENAKIMTQRLQGFIKGVITVIKILGETFVFLANNMKNIIAIATFMAAVFAIVEIAAVKAGIASAAAWLKAMAPFVAIAAAVGVVLLLLDDIQGYMNGKDSVFGDFVNALNDLFAPKATDTWFVAIIKDFITEIRKAVALVDQFNDKTAGTWDKIATLLSYTPAGLAYKVAGAVGGTIGNTLARARGRAADAEYTAANPNAASSQTPMYYRAPEVRGDWVTREGGGWQGKGSIQATVPITIYQQPGENGEALAQRVKEMWQGEWMNVLSQAEGGVGK